MNSIFCRAVSASLSVLIAGSSLLAEPPLFKTHRLGNYRSEACGVGDFNGDGKLDIVAGPF
ncbi:hypothetical protein LCGC14_3046940, partial [marine sediment metagenome]